MSGLASRRAAEAFIISGRITVNGVKVTDLAVRVDPVRDRICFDGQCLRPAGKKVYIMLNKPKGVVTTLDDERGRKTVISLLNISERVFPVGRLDRNSEGLLLLTNDGDLAYVLMHPRHKVAKTYRVRLDREFAPEDFTRLTGGIELDDGPTQPCSAGFYSEEARDRVQIRLREGRRHQIRRMFKALGYDVLALRRIQYGPMSLKGLARGQYRHLTSSEIKQLMAIFSRARKI